MGITKWMLVVALTALPKAHGSDELDDFAADLGGSAAEESYEAPESTERPEQLDGDENDVAQEVEGSMPGAEYESFTERTPDPETTTTERLIPEPIVNEKTPARVEKKSPKKKTKIAAKKKAKKKIAKKPKSASKSKKLAKLSKRKNKKT